jgi:Protein of unknown function (DUF4239)
VYSTLCIVCQYLGFDTGGCPSSEYGCILVPYKSENAIKRGEDSTLSTVLVGGLILSLAILLAVAGLIFAQHRIPLELRQSHNVPLGLIYGALYVTFGVIIGFSAYLVLNKYTSSQTTVVNEASAIRALYYLAGQFPEAQRDQIQELATSYARVVVDEEWPLMREGQSSPKAAALNQQITKSIDGFQPSTSPEQALYSQALQRDYDLNQNRNIRLLYAREGLPPILWFVLGVLAVIILLFTYFVGMESARLHILAVAALTLGFAFTMFTIITLDQPFEGDLRVSPEAFEIVLNEIEGDSQPAAS